MSLFDVLSKGFCSKKRESNEILSQEDLTSDKLIGALFNTNLLDEAEEFRKLIEELRGLIEFKPVVDEVVRTHRVSHARLVKHRVYPTAEQAKDIVDWIRSYGGRLVDVARIAGCAHSTLSLIRSGTRRSFTLDMYNKIMKAREELEGLAA